MKSRSQLTHPWFQIALLNFPNMTLVESIKHRRDTISDIRFSPDGKYLAVACSDCFIDVYELNSDPIKRIATCKVKSVYFIAIFIHEPNTAFIILTEALLF